MPLYEYKCSSCNKRFSKVRPMILYMSPANCPHCGGAMTGKKQVSIPRVISDDLGTTHMDDTFGNIHSKSELRNLEKKAGLRVVEPGDKRHAQSARRDKAKKQDAVREQIIGDTVRSMVT